MWKWWKGVFEWTPRFTKGQRVKVVDGFCKGRTGKVIDTNLSGLFCWRTYLIELDAPRKETGVFHWLFTGVLQDNANAE